MSLTTVELDNLLSTNEITKLYYKGTYPADNLPIAETPYSFISNTERHDKKGTHWTAWMVFENNTIMFLDSFGRPPLDSTFPQEYHAFTKGHKYRYNPKVIESLDGFTCGYFCAYAIYFLSLDIDLKYIYNSFTNDLNRNDMLAVNFVNMSL